MEAARKANTAIPRATPTPWATSTRVLKICMLYPFRRLVLDRTGLDLVDGLLGQHDPAGLLLELDVHLDVTVWVDVDVLFPDHVCILSVRSVLLSTLSTFQYFCILLSTL